MSVGVKHSATCFRSGAMPGSNTVGNTASMYGCALVRPYFASSQARSRYSTEGLIAMRPSDLHRGERSERRGDQLREGLAYVWATDQLRRPLVIMALVFTLAFNFTVLVPLAAYHTFHGDSRTLGLLSAAAGSGMLVAALTLANRAPHPTWRRLTGFAAAMGVMTLIEGAMPNLGLAYVAMVPVGFAAMSFAITANSTMQLHSRANMRGRVMALYGVIFLGSTPIGAPIIGWVGQHLGPRAGFALSGIAALAAAAYGLYVDGAFPTADSRARFLPVAHAELAEPPDRAFPLILTTGRVRDHWHTLTRTGQAPALRARTPEPVVEINVADALRAGIQDGDFVEIASRRGKLIAQCRVTSAIREGVCFAPFHWGRRLGFYKSANNLTLSARDPLSRQPELKACAVRLRRVAS